MLQGPIELKNHKLRWLLQVSKTGKVWISLNPSMFYSGCVEIPGSISPSFSTFSKFWQSFLNDSVMIQSCPIALSMLPAFPFYSVVVGLRGTTIFSLLLPLVLELVLCQLLRGLVLSLFLIIFSFWCCFPESPLLNFRFKVPSGSCPHLLALYLFSFCLSLFLSFFPSGRNHFLPSWRFSSHFLFLVLPFGFSEILPPFVHKWLLRAFWFLIVSLSAWGGHICPSFLAPFWYFLWAASILP